MVQPVGLVFLDSKLVVGWGSSILLGRSDTGLVPQTQRSVGAQGAISLNQYTFMRLCYVEKTHQKIHSSRCQCGIIRDHRAHTPHFPLLATEFLDYLEGLSDNSDKPEAQILFRYPFAKELAHYEWVELDVQIALEPNLPEGSQQITLRDGLSINPTAHVLAYEWPVHLIGPDFQPTEAPDAPTFLAVFQNVNAQSEFILLTPLAALLLENIEQRATCSTAEHIRILAQQHEDLSEADLSESVLEIADQFREQGLITGETISDTP